MRKLFYIIVVMILFGLNVQAQQVVSWDELAIPFKINADGSFEPNFMLAPKKYNNEEIVIQGYLVPIDVEAKQYALSRYAFSSCFFCGNAAPNTVMELQFKEMPDSFVTDQWVVLKGFFQFIENRKDENKYRVFFVLKSAELHG